MRRPLPIFMLVSALVVGTAAWWWIADPGMHELSDDAELDADGRMVDEREAAASARRDLQARARNMSVRDRQVDEPVSTPYGSGQIDRETAVAGFDEIMGEVEAFAKSRERIHREEWDTMYRSANDAFSVLSNHLDAHDPGDRESLEDAHRRLQEGLRRVRVRGQKFSDM